MSKLNQAFIRAYTKDAIPAAAPQAAVPKTPAPAAQPAANPPVGAQHRVDAASSARGPHTRAAQSRPAASPAVKPLAPDQVFHLLDAPRESALPGPHLRIVTVDDHADIEAEQESPLASAATQSVFGETTTAVAPRSAGLQPAWQVEALPWPSACESIAMRIAQPLDALCAELGRYSRLGQKVVCLSGCHTGEGRTSVVLLLAKRLAATGLRVALIDGHFGSPAVAQQLGLAPTSGWTELLEQNLPLEEALVESVADGVALLPLEAPLEYEQVARHPRVWAVVRQLRAAYDLVLIDTAPLGAQTEASFTATPTAMFHPDAAILVRDARATSGRQLQAAVRALRAAGVSTWGIIENFARG